MTSAFTDIKQIPWEPPDSRGINAIYGLIGGWSLDMFDLSAGGGAKKVGMSAKGGNEKFYVGNPASPLVIMGQLKDITGVDEYGLYVKAGAVYIAGYRLYEAVIDPAGLGDYSTIAAALAAGKKRLFLRNGTHVISANLAVSADSSVIEGESKEGVIIQSGNTVDASTYYIDVTGANCTLKNFTKTGISNAGYPIQGSGNGCKIDNVCLKNDTVGHRGIYLTGDDVQVINSRIEASTRALYLTGARPSTKNTKVIQTNEVGTVVEITGADAVYTGNVLQIAESNYGFSLSGANGLVSDNDFLCASNTTGAGMLIDGDFARVFGNHIEGFDDGIICTSDKGVIIDRNQLANQGGEGITLDMVTGAGKGGHTVSGNFVDNPAGHGILVNYGKRINIIGNSVFSPNGDGIRANDAYDFKYCNVIGNYVQEGAASGFYGLKNGHTHEYNNWNDNIAEGNAVKGFYLDCTSSNANNNIAVGNGTNYDITTTGGNKVNNL